MASVISSSLPSGVRQSPLCLACHMVLLVGVLVTGAVQADPLRQGRAQDLAAQALAHEHGEGVARDLERAAELYCRAARLGDPESQFALGWMYANGRGLERDDEQAGALFALAAAKGHEQAARMLRFTGDGGGRSPSCMRGGGGFLAEASGDLESRINRLPADRRAIADLVVQLAERHEISPTLALAIALTESAMNPAAVSPKNAMGVMQLIPETAARFNVRNAFDPEQNIRGGLSYLRWLLAYFEGDIALAAAAYNAGEGAVERYRGVPPFRETQAYVQRIMQFVQHPEHPYDSSVVRPSAIMSTLRPVALALSDDS
ncbi:transglycosylase SLT domain-containing protein [Azoarcus taiwanensis]|nr:transglycosylase SLT domain-containing protein [Azoarcus taiwanensis]